MVPFVGPSLSPDLSYSCVILKAHRACCFRIWVQGEVELFDVSSDVSILKVWY